MPASPGVASQGFVQTPVRWVTKFSTLVLVLAVLLLAGCETATGSASSACDYDYRRLMESGWTFYSQTSIDIGNNQQQCVFLYQVDNPRRECNTDGQGHCPQIYPVLGAVYRKDRDRSRDIHQYDLKLPHDMYLGEHYSGTNDRVTPHLEDVLSGLPGQELVIKDRDADNVTVQVSIFQWRGEEPESEKNRYQSRGWFIGNAGVNLEPDKVTILNRLWATRSQLAERRVYKPKEKKSYYKKDAAGKDIPGDFVDPETIDWVSLDMPLDQNLTTAEYPEKLLLALYERSPMTDTARLSEWMPNDVLAAYLVRDKAFGCLVDPKLDKVYVQNINTDGSQGIPEHLNQADYTQTDTVVVTSMCRVNSNGKTVNKQIVLEWPVRWDWKVDARTGRWQLQKPKIVKQ